MKLEEAFSLKEREVISLVGGGGKTTLMFALGKELSSRGKGVILTTTTKIWEPAACAPFTLLLCHQLSEIKKGIRKNRGRHPYVLIARERLEGGKLQGIPPEWVDALQSFEENSVIVVEADGAAGRSLKAPREGEPVVPQSTSLLVPVVGIDILGCPLDEQHVFRSEIAAKLLNLPAGIRVTEEIIAALVAETIKNRPEKARVIPFINKVDIPGGLDQARNLARSLIGIDRGKIARVLLGQAQHSPVVKEIVLY